MRAPGQVNRRRGAVLEQAIYDATLAELAITGYVGLTMDGVAERARTGKAALYRRWASKRDLVLDALLRVLPDPQDHSPRGSVRDDLLATLMSITDILAGRTAFPGLTALTEMLGDPEFRTAFRARVVEPRLSLIQQILREGNARGEIRLPSDTALVTRVGPALVIQGVLLTGEAPPPSEIVRIVDTILMPLLGAPTGRP